MCLQSVADRADAEQEADPARCANPPRRCRPIFVPTNFNRLSKPNRIPLARHPLHSPAIADSRHEFRDAAARKFCGRTPCTDKHPQTNASWFGESQRFERFRTCLTSFATYFSRRGLVRVRIGDGPQGDRSLRIEGTASIEERTNSLRKGLFVLPPTPTFRRGKSEQVTAYFSG